MKKAVSIIMCVILLLCATPLSEIAELDIALLKVSAAEDDELAETGQCGENLYWNFDSETGTLTISGTGEMTNHLNDSDKPFYNKSYIKTVIIESGVTSIEGRAFYNLTGLTSVTMENSLTSIGSSAFSGCTALKDVYFNGTEEDWNAITINSGNDPLLNAAKHFLGQTEGLLSWIIENGEVTITDCKADAKGEIVIPGNIEGYPVTVIGSHSFEDCTEITEITIPDSVINIQNYAFYNCSGIKKLTMPCSAKIYDSPRTFYECISMEEITLTIGTSIMQNYSERNNIFPSASKTYYEHTPWFISRNNIQSINIEDGINNIGDYAFCECTCLKSFTIPDSIGKIGKGAFYNCKELTGIYIPENIADIGSDAFSGCNRMSRIEVSEYNTVYDSRDNCNAIIKTNNNRLIAGCKNTIIPAGVTSIGENAFFGCTELKDISIPEGVTTIDNSAFGGCTGLNTVIIPNSMLNIGSGAFNNCKGLGRIMLPDGVLSIGNRAFKNCNNLKEIIIGSEVKTIGESAFSGCYGLDRIVVSSGNIVYDSRKSCNAIIETDTDKLISGCKNTIIPDNVTSIGRCAFDDCMSLTSIEIPDSVTDIEFSAFNDCTGLISVTIGKGVLNIENYVFSRCTRLESIVIPDNVIRIGDGVFSGCTNLINISLSDNTMSFGLMAFNNTGYYNDINNWDNDVLYIGNHLIEALDTVSGEYQIKPGVKTIASYAFSDCKELTSIIIPDSVVAIGNNAFNLCTRLKSIMIPENAIEIGDLAFNGTGYAKDEKNWDNGVLYICNYLVDAKSSISGTYQVKEGTKRIAYGAFWGCSELTSITIPESVTSIGEYAFYGCTGLTNVILPDSITNIGRYAFKECSNITSVRMSNSIEIIREGTFSCCTGLIDIIIPDSVTQIDSLVFFKCTGLKRITLSKNIKGLKSAVFSGCTSIENITIPDNVKIIGSQAFYNCSALKEITFPDNYLRIESKSFYGCTNLVNVIIHNEVDFERDTFSGADKVTLINAEDNAPNTKVLAEQYKVNRIDVVYKMNKKVIYFVGDTTVYEGVEYDYIMKALNNYSEAEYMFFSKLVFDGLKKEDFIMDIDNEMDVSIIDSSAEDLTFNNLYINISMLDENGSANVTFEYLLNEMKNGNGDAFSIVLQSDEGYYEQSVVTKAVNKIFEDALNVIARAINWIARRFR